MVRHRFLSALIVLSSVFAACGDDEPVGPGSSRGDLTNPRIRPQVIGTYPAHGATGPFDLFVPGEYSKPHFIV